MTSAAMVALWLGGCSRSGGSAPGEATLPQSLHGLPLVETRSGTAARSEIHRLHGKGVAPEESRIGLYGQGEMRAVVYASRFASESETRAQLDAMAVRIGDGSSGFGHQVTFEVSGTNVHRVVGHGQVHYFYARGHDLVWLASPASLARPALAELLGVGVEEVPRTMPRAGSDLP